MNQLTASPTVNQIVANQTGDLANVNNQNNELANVNQFPSDEGEEIIDWSRVNSQAEQDNREEIATLKTTIAFQQEKIEELYTGMTQLINYINTNIEPILKAKAEAPAELTIEQQYLKAREYVPQYVRMYFNLTPTSHIEGTIKKGTYHEVPCRRFNDDILLWLRKQNIGIDTRLNSSYIYKIMFEQLNIRFQARHAKQRFYQGVQDKAQVECGPGGTPPGYSSPQ